MRSKKKPLQLCVTIAKKISPPLRLPVSAFSSMFHSHTAEPYPAGEADPAYPVYLFLLIAMIEIEDYRMIVPIVKLFYR